MVGYSFCRINENLLAEVPEKAEVPNTGTGGVQFCDWTLNPGPVVGRGVRLVE